MTNPTLSDWQSRVDTLWASFDTLDAATFLQRMIELVSGRPQDDPMALFELASAHDSTDHEAEAAALYRRHLPSVSPAISAGALLSNWRARCAISARLPRLSPSSAPSNPLPPTPSTTPLGRS